MNPDLIGAPYAVTRTHFSYALLVTYHFSGITFRIISTNQQKWRKIMALKKVLVTGMSGLIGGLVRERLEGKYTAERTESPTCPRSGMSSSRYRGSGRYSARF